VGDRRAVRRVTPLAACQEEGRYYLQTSRYFDDDSDHIHQCIGLAVPVVALPALNHSRRKPL